VKLPEVLSASDVADVLVRVGFPVDRQNVARALHQAPVDGVIAPGRIGQGWRVPRSALLDVFATCLWRRAQRERAPRGHGPGSPAAYRVDAAELLMEERELARLVPRSLKQAVRQRWGARRRAEEERRRRQEEWEKKLDDLVWGKFRKEEERRRREREELERSVEEGRRKEEERKQRRLLEDTYQLCRHSARAAYGVTYGHGWNTRPENQPYLRDWPGSPPDWWLPPPGLAEFVQAEGYKFYHGGTYNPPAWDRWVPRYTPGQPWPWRKRDGADDAGAG
jgi:hypothetical protein